MSERELSTLLLDHLADEPPVGIASSEAIRTARRQARGRLAVAGVGVAAVLGVAAATLPGLVSGDGPSRGKDAPAATRAGTEVPGTLEELAATQLVPYVGELGAPTWDVLDVDGNPVDPADEGAQYFEVGYQPAGSAIVQLHVGGFAPKEWDLYDFDSTCRHSEAEAMSVSCEQATLEDGSLLVTSVAPYTNVTNTTKRLITVAEALAHPRDVLWARSVSISTRAGVTAGVSELVRADSPDTAPWQLPVEVLRAIATDPDLADPAAVAHVEVPEITTP